jgi:glycosyltransferase involved in cell wall biosynthesis
MCGTPVIAFNRGSMEELIINRKTGFLVHNTSEAVVATGKIKTISRLACREHALATFSSQVMARHYMQLYEKVSRIPGGL